MIQINNISARIARHKSQIQSSIDRVIASGWFVLGNEVKHFEQSFAAYTGVEECVSVANGTDAIELALKALGVGPGDQVATAANAGMYTTSSLLAIGAEPLFLDVDLDSRVITLAEVQRAVASGVKAIVVTHLYGLALPEIEIIAEYCREHDVVLVEDCAQAHGARVNGRCAGSFGDAACFSFYPTKNLGALGDGGAVVTSSTQCAEKLRMLRQYGWSGKYRVEMPGARNSRLDEIQAAILADLLPHLDESNTRRREIAALYSSNISNNAVSLPSVRGNEYVAHLYVIRSKQRDALRDHLHNLDISSDIHYPLPDYRQPVFGNRFADVILENTETLGREVLTLPCYPEMDNDEVNYIIESINGWSS